MVAVIPDKNNKPDRCAPPNNPEIYGNRATKTTPWGTIEYEYDEENRLIRRGDIEYINDMDGNVLSERGLRYEAWYEYNGQNRMTHSEVTSHAERTHAVSFYAYDALGRRTITESLTGQMLRTVYDGMGFEVIREGETFRDGSLTTQFATSERVRAGTSMQSNQPTGERYRWISEDYNGGNTSADGYSMESSRYGTRGVTLYGNGEAVAVSYSSSASSRSVYLGKDILGSVRTATTDGGAVEDRYEYDAFGQVYKGDLSGGMNLGYTGKPYDAGTGLYNYGYRDYRPQVARFTTVDPIRDGSNWYAYVNNDPVNWIDPWGLREVDASKILKSFKLGPGSLTTPYNDMSKTEKIDLGNNWINYTGWGLGWVDDNTDLAIALGLSALILGPPIAILYFTDPVAKSDIKNIYGFTKSLFTGGSNKTINLGPNASYTVNAGITLGGDINTNNILSFDITPNVNLRVSLGLGINIFSGAITNGGDINTNNILSFDITPKASLSVSIGLGYNIPSRTFNDPNIAIKFRMTR
jgi:RHS repeat-associated protein